MSLRRIDTRFALPEEPKTAVVLGNLDGWQEGLAGVGVTVRRSGPADLVVAPVALAAEAHAINANAILLEGRGGRRRLAASGLRARAILVRPELARPQLLLPPGEPKLASYAIRHWSAGYTRSKRARNLIAGGLVRVGLLPEIEPVIAVGTTASSAQPYVVQAARPLGVPPDAAWFMTCGHGDALSRNVFHLFRRGADEPSWVLKFSRIAGYDEPFERDERGLSLAAGSAPVAAHAPRLLGRFAVNGVEASLETAAPGPRLRTVLVSPRARRVKLRIVDEIAGWLLAVARETASPPEALRAELDRLERDVVPAWSAAGATAELVRDLPALPAVLQHNDLGCWNLVVGGSGFTAVDWESARRHGLPMWDLVYFLTDALVTLEGASSPSAQDDAARRLLRGESRFSGVLFDWVARAVRELAIPPEAVGPVVTLGWLHHGLSREARAGALGQVADGEASLPAPVGRLVPIWLGDPALGPEWKAWRER